MRDWLFDCEYRQHSPRTLAIRRFLLDKLLWFLRQREYSHCGLAELRQFLAYASTGRTEEGGRWGNAQMMRYATANYPHLSRPPAYLLCVDG
ncbi:MAG TPA: hypothetical protein VF600_18375 [Abditibacteriaceae bacterium]|jgi:hypothetical protein